MGTEDKGEVMGDNVRSSAPPRRTEKEWCEKSSREQNHYEKPNKAFWKIELLSFHSS
jgi:hypothetical protein